MSDLMSALECAWVTSALLVIVSSVVAIHLWPAGV